MSGVLRAFAQMKLAHVCSLVDGEIIVESTAASSLHQMRRLVALFTNLRAAEDPFGQDWALDIKLSAGTKAQTIRMPIEQFLERTEYDASLTAPICFADLRTARGSDPAPHWLWLFRNRLYATERNPRPSEFDEVTLRIRAFQLQHDDELKRLREQVANLEAAERFVGGSATRRALPDDVKLVVWARDGGRCVRCGAAQELHFDHIIPFSRGGSDLAENIQLLCRTCNLSKGARLV